MRAEEITAAIRARGWTCRPKEKRGKMYVYAVRRSGKRLEEKYVGACDNPYLMNRIRERLVDKKR